MTKTSAQATKSCNTSSRQGTGGSQSTIKALIEERRQQMLYRVLDYTTLSPEIRITWFNTSLIVMMLSNKENVLIYVNRQFFTANDSRAGVTV